MADLGRGTTTSVDYEANRRRMRAFNTWEHPPIVDDERIDHEDPDVRRAAEFQHRNESLHRHNPSGVVCVYCALAASNVARVLRGAYQPVQTEGADDV